MQVTTHAVHPVRFLSVSAAGDLCYTWDGEIWVRPAGAHESRRIEVSVGVDGRETASSRSTWPPRSREFDLSPDAKEVAFVARGEVFVASVEHGTTRRITDTPEQERSVSFSPDGKSLLYAGERGGSWNVYRTDRTDPEEPAFFNAYGPQGEGRRGHARPRSSSPTFRPTGRKWPISRSARRSR